MGPGKEAGRGSARKLAARWLLAALVCALVLPAALQAATVRQSFRCPPGMTVASHHRCLARLPATAKDPSGAVEQLVWSAVAAGTPPPVKQRQANRVPKPLRNGIPGFIVSNKANAALQRAIKASSAGNAAANFRVDTPSASGSVAGPTVNGWQTQLSGNSTDDANRIGQQDVDATVTATKETKQDDVQLSGVIALETRNRQLVDRCPNADGTVPGDGTTRYDLRLQVAGGDGSHQATASGSGYVHFDWTYLGHVADNGTLTSFDLKLKATVLTEGGLRGADGKLYSAEPPKLWTVSTEIDDIDPNNPEQVKTFGMDLGGRAQAHSFLGHQYFQDKIAKDLVDLVQRQVTFNLLETARYYKQAEANWQSSGACVHVTPAASATNLSPGQTEPVTVTIAGPPNKGTAPGRFSATSSAGTISPASGTYGAGQPVQLTFAAPQSGDATVTVQTTSRQGMGSGSVTFHIRNPSYKLVFTSTGQLAYSGAPEAVAAAPTQGSETRNEQWQMSSTIPLSGSPTTGLTGSAPIDYQQAAYHLEFDGWFSGQAGFYSCYGSDKNDLTGTAPGVAVVQNLTIPTPTTASLTFNPGNPQSSETFSYDDENPGQPGTGKGQCPGGSGTSTGNRWWSEDMYFNGQQGTTTYAQGQQVVKIDSGWQPGSGDVIATRTVSGSFPWGGAPGTPSASSWTDTYQIVASSN